MAPKPKYTREQMIDAAVNVVRKSGFAALTAKSLAAELQVSTQPIFTCFTNMEEVIGEVMTQVAGMYRSSILEGLKEPIPFLGVGRQFVRFAKTEPELYRLLFLTSPKDAGMGPMEAMKFAQNLARESLMKNYRMDAATADKYFRDLWLFGLSLGVLIVTDDCPYDDAELENLMAEVSLSICKAYKEIPGLPEGKFDKGKVFRALIEEN